MRFTRLHVEKSLSAAYSVPERRSLRNWRALVALLTALSFVALLLTAATHHHSNAIEDHECAVCSVAVQKIANTNLVTVPQMVAVLVFYAPFVAESRTVLRGNAILLPPLRGPPPPLFAII